jgi:hypothetical protein
MLCEQACDAVHTDCYFHTRKTMDRQSPSRSRRSRPCPRARSPSWALSLSSIRQFGEALDGRRALLPPRAAPGAPAPRRSACQAPTPDRSPAACATKLGPGGGKGATRVPGPQRSRARSTGAAWRRYRPRNGCHPACRVSPSGRRALARSLASVTSNMTGASPCAAA